MMHYNTPKAPVTGPEALTVKKQACSVEFCLFEDINQSLS